MRLGDLDALKKSMCELCHQDYSDEPCEPSDCVFYNAIENAPTIDAVPVVRCRECKHYREFHTKKHRQIMRLCYRMGKHDMEYPVKPDDFCSYGQRKEADHEVSE